MTKTLIIMSHPDVAQSSSQQFLLAAIKGEEQIQIRHLESILAEQENNHFDKRIERACLRTYCNYNSLVSFSLFF